MMVQTWVLNSNSITLLAKKKKMTCRKAAKVNASDPCMGSSRVPTVGTWS